MRSNLSAAEQVAYLRDAKDVKFNYMSEEDAERFLADRNYFFKLKAFAKNYDKRFAGGDAKGRYIGLDFAYLVELSRIDKQLRDLVLDLTLDIEHCLKVRINRSAMAACCDPGDLAARYLAYSRENVVKEQVSKVDPCAALNSFSQMRSLLDGLGENDDPHSVVALANELGDLLRVATMGRDPDHVRGAYSAMGTRPIPRAYSRSMACPICRTGVSWS